MRLTADMDGQDDNLGVSQQKWNREIYYLQMQAPKPKKVECHIEIPNRPEYYGTEFHGDITRHEAELLLKEDASYLVRESKHNAGCYTLVIRFNGGIKNFMLYYDSQLRQHYVGGPKRFDSMDDLVHDGLICFYVNLKAPEYIASQDRGDVSVYEESPYMRYRAEMVDREVENRREYLKQQTDSRRQGLSSQSPPRPPMRSNLMSTGPQLPARPRSEISQHRPPPPTPLSEPPARRVSGDALDAHKVSSAQQAGDWMDIMQQEKQHNFKVTSFKNIAQCWCEFCFHFMWGLIQQGVECQDCGFRAHKKCSEKLPNDCMPNMKKLKRIFGLDLTTLLKATNKSIPSVVEKCIEEIESRGLHHEGLYRVAGFHDDIEQIRKAFDLDGDAEITTRNYEDIATITSVLKLFFRQLPVPLITFDTYPKLTEAVTKYSAANQEESQRDLVMDLKTSLTALPVAHYQTLKYLIGHLNRVTQKKSKNMMSADNLAIVFSPTILQSPQNDPIAAMTAGRIETKAIESLIINYMAVFER